jgi:hypothetical protein
LKPESATGNFRRLLEAPEKKKGSTLPSEWQETLRVERAQSQRRIQRGNCKLRFCAVDECPSATGVHHAGVWVQPYSSVRKLCRVRVLAS